MPVLKIKKDGVWEKVKKISMLSVGGSGGIYEDVNEKYY